MFINWASVAIISKIELVICSLFCSKNASQLILTMHHSQITDVSKKVVRPFQVIKLVHTNVFWHMRTKSEPALSHICHTLLYYWGCRLGPVRLKSSSN